MVRLTGTHGNFGCHSLSIGTPYMRSKDFFHFLVVKSRMKESEHVSPGKALAQLEAAILIRPCFSTVSKEVLATYACKTLNRKPYQGGWETILPSAQRQCGVQR